MRVAVFRTRDDGERTATALAELGHEAVLLPVLDVAPLGAPLPDIAPDAVIVTSRQGVAAIDRDPRLAAIQAVPCLCVGEATARDARRLGFRDVRPARGTAEALTGMVRATVPAGSSLLFLTGRHRKGDVEAILGPSYRVTVLEVYEAREAATWPAAGVATLLEGSVEAALHYSARSAALAVELATRHGALDLFLPLEHHCLAADIAVPLREAGATRIAIAPEPTEGCLLGSL